MVKQVVCPTCGHRRPWKAVRICWLCKLPIGRGHKWQLVRSRIQHRHCDNPDDYFSPAERAAMERRRR